MKIQRTLLSFALTLLAAAGILVPMGRPQSAKASSIDTPVLERSEGYTLRFKANPNAAQYVINDETDYRNGLILTNDDADSNGFIYYTTETVGEHNVTVDAYVNGNVLTSNEVTVTNDPVFFYGAPTSLFFHDVTNNEAGKYSILQEDGTYLVCTPDEYNTTHMQNKGNAVDFSDANHVDEIVMQMKSAGANILFLDSRSVSIEDETWSNAWWCPQNATFQETVCYRYMEAAWKVGMKCIINDFTIESNSFADNNTSTIERRMNSPRLQEAFMHPAFYGLELADEPFKGTDMVNVGNTVDTIRNFWNSHSVLKNRPLPHIHTALRSYDLNKSEEFGYFDSEEDYKNYIKSWFDETGLDYMAFDTYTYTTRIYGVHSPALSSSKYYYDPSKAIYDAINAAKEELKEELGKEFDVIQVLTASTDTSMKETLTEVDVFSSMLLAVGEDVEGYAAYSFQEGYTSEGAAFAYDTTYSDAYSYLKKMNKQYAKIQSLLEGYDATSINIGSYGGNYKPIFSSAKEYYGPGLRTVETTFTNKTNPSLTYQYTANFESNSANTTKSVTVPSGRIYYLFGPNYETYQRVGTGETVTINNGEAILISSESIQTVSGTSIDKNLLEDYDVVTIKDVTRRESINNDEGYNVGRSQYYEVNSNRGSVALRFNYKADQLGTAWGDGLFDIYINGFEENANDAWGGFMFGVGCNQGGVIIKEPNVYVNNVLTAGVDNIVEVGAIKIKNTNQVYLYISVNGEVIVSDVRENTVANSDSNSMILYCANSDTNRVMSAHSVNLKRKVTSGEISNLSGDSKNIYFTASNYNDIDFKLKSGQVRTFYDNGTTEISKIGYNRYKLSLGESYNVSAGERITLGDLYVADINGVRHSFELNEVTLYFTGSTWVNIKSLDQIDIRMNIAYTATFINGTVSNDRVFMKFSMSDLYTEELSSIGEYGIQVSTSSQTRRYPVENLRLDTVNNERYLIIDLGDAISQNRYNDMFTVTAYLKVGETVITSTNTSSGSIFALVEAMYNNVATQNLVTNLYNYMK
ncbi:MAG: hypothetical protein IKB70_01430 [Bacilli bacterium]|nr:hypothetical protein [Bacilli bacterium]